MILCNLDCIELEKRHIRNSLISMTNDQSNYDSSNQNQTNPNNDTVNSNPTTLCIVIRKICQK